MTVSPDARTPSATVHPLSGSTPPGAGATMQPFGVATAAADVAELPDTFAPLGGAGHDVCRGSAERVAPVELDAEVVDLARRVERLAVREHGLWERGAAIADAALEAMPPKPECRRIAPPTIEQDQQPDGSRSIRLSLPPGFARQALDADAEHKAALAEWYLRRDEEQVRRGGPTVEKLRCRATLRLERWGMQLAAMEPKTQAGLKAKAAASKAAVEDGVLPDEWRQKLAVSLGRDALRVIGDEADASYERDQAMDGELLALGRAWERCAKRHEDAIVLREEAESRMPEREWPAALCFDFDNDPSVLGAYTVQHVPTDQRRYAFPAVERMRRPWPFEFCRARRDEILAAYDAWDEQREADEEAAGLSAAESALWQAAGENAALRRRILAIPARTAAGALAKVKVACWCLGDVAGMEVDLEGYVRTGDVDDEAFACGALLDVARVLGQQNVISADTLPLPTASAA